MYKKYFQYTAFAALKTDGTVVTWGQADYGGNSSAVEDDLVNVQKIVSTFWGGAFAALRTDGTIVTWGDYVEDGVRNESE